MRAGGRAFAGREQADQRRAAVVDSGSVPLRAEPAPDLPDAALETLRAAMSRDAGVVRDAPGLRRLLAKIAGLEAAHGRALPLVAARLVAEGALTRRESRGAHFRTDYPGLAAPERSRVTLTLAPISVAAA